MKNMFLTLQKFHNLSIVLLILDNAIYLSIDRKVAEILEFVENWQSLKTEDAIP